MFFPAPGVSISGLNTVRCTSLSADILGSGRWFDSLFLLIHKSTDSCDHRGLYRCNGSRSLFFLHFLWAFTDVSKAILQPGHFKQHCCLHFSRGQTRKSNAEEWSNLLVTIGEHSYISHGAHWAVYPHIILLSEAPTVLTVHPHYWVPFCISRGKTLVNWSCCTGSCSPPDPHSLCCYLVQGSCEKN